MLPDICTYTLYAVAQHALECLSHFVSKLAMTYRGGFIQEGDYVLEVCCLINNGVDKVLKAVVVGVVAYR